MVFLSPLGLRPGQKRKQMGEENSTVNEVIVSNTSRSSIFDDDNVLREEDVSFMDMHLERSPKHPKFLITNLKDDDKATFMTADLLFQGGVVSSLAIHTIREMDYTYCDMMLKPVNGLVGFFCDKINSGVCIRNLGTREVTPWIKSTLLSDLCKHDREPFGVPWASCTLGYSPSTKEHKVVGIWRSQEHSRLVCELLTVGDNEWRKIDEVTGTLSKVEVSGISSGPCFSASSRNTIFFESLLPVNKRRGPAVQLPTLVPGHPLPPPFTSPGTTGGLPKSSSSNKCTDGKHGRQSSKRNKK